MTARASVSLSVRKLATAWFFFALVSLGFSALAAAVPLAARLDLLGWNSVLHVQATALHAALGMPLWLLGMVAGSLTLATARAGIAAWGSWWLALASLVALLVSPWFAGEPVPSPFLPLLDHPLFLGGLGSFGLSVGMVVLRCLPDLRRLTTGTSRMQGLAWVALSLSATLVLLLTVVVRTDTVEGLVAPLQGINHAFQFVYVLVTLVAWVSLAPALLPVQRRILQVIYALAVLPVAASIVLTLAFPAAGPGYQEGLAWLARWASWPAAALLAALLAVRLSDRASARAYSTEVHGLVLSMLLFAAGVGAGAASSGVAGALPVSLHGMLGSVTFASLLCWRRLMQVPLIGEPLREGLGIIALVYGYGMLVLVVASAFAQGVLNEGDISYQTMMRMAVLGGSVAVLATLTYVVTGTGAILSVALKTGKERRDIRPWAIVITLLLVIGGGWLLQSLPRTNGAFSPREHAAAQIKTDIDARFQQGIVMLHAKQYEHALTAFHRVLQLAPKMPEAHVNMGFALIGLGRYKEASDFFESATQLHRNQVNAYFGLAVALEGMGDLPGALGAMETYVHLTKADDPFLPKARAAIWEWRAALEGAKVSPLPDAG